MTPAARIQAAIELLDLIDNEPPPADRVVSLYCRRRRYIGSKDRRAVTDLVFRALRSRARIAWWLDRCALTEHSTRLRIIAQLVLDQIQDHEFESPVIASLFDGKGYHPVPLTEAEQKLAEVLAGNSLAHPDQPLAVRCELPEWLLPNFQAAFGKDVEKELIALQAEAPLDLRINCLKATRAEAIATLAVDGIPAEETPLSPLGLRISGRYPLQNSSAYRNGLVEIQDEGSQLVAALCDARPGMLVADFCAGAGGKTLALAGAMRGSGHIVALDVDSKRLTQLTPRMNRAGVETIEQRLLPDDDWLQNQLAHFDRVLVDAPCSGCGAWRRNPDARWRLTPETLAAHSKEQTAILTAAAPLVRPGGRLIYATCSLLSAENETPVAEFLDGNPDFAMVPIDRVWETVLGGPCPVAPCPANGPNLLLTPARHGTDGFFIAVLERREVA